METFTASDNQLGIRARPRPTELLRAAAAAIDRLETALRALVAFDPHYVSHSWDCRMGAMSQSNSQVCDCGSADIARTRLFDAARAALLEAGK